MTKLLKIASLAGILVLALTTGVSRLQAAEPDRALPEGQAIVTDLDSVLEMGKMLRAKGLTIGEPLPPGPSGQPAPPISPPGILSNPGQSVVPPVARPPEQR